MIDLMPFINEENIIIHRINAVWQAMVSTQRIMVNIINEGQSKVVNDEQGTGQNNQ